MSHTEPGKVATPYRVPFDHRGRQFQLYKRHQTKAAPYQLCLVRKWKRHRHSLETNDQKVAIERAKSLIDKVVAEKWQDLEALKNRQPGPTIGRVFELYPQLAQVQPITVRNNISSMRWLIESATGKKLEPERFLLSSLTGALVATFQRQMVARYQSSVPRTIPAQREAQERALRSSRSVIKQARSLFAKKRGLPGLYVAQGVKLPGSVESFMTCALEGRIQKQTYHAPDDAVVAKAFDEIEKVRDNLPDVFVAFWLAIGAGLRRGEVQQMRWEFMIERSGSVWISGGIGKDGQKIEVPMQQRAVKALTPLRKKEGRCLTCASLEWARTLNSLMRSWGWNTQKKMHELRAYVGSLIYRESPAAAMAFLRHKTIRQTEQAYVRYGQAELPPQVL